MDNINTLTEEISTAEILKQHYIKVEDLYHSTKHALIKNICLEEMRQIREILEKSEQIQKEDNEWER